MQKIPLWARKFATDFVEVLVPSLVLIQVALPSDMDGLVKLAGAVAAAVGSAFLSAGRRNWPGFKDWFRGLMGTTEQL